ncbi:hypothetical protein EC991_008241 [Linnemannia zychae]|nr:hypothetical protein EC991_008241 [Linnemannia zychae]
MESLKMQINIYQERIPLLTKMIESSREQLCDLSHYQNLTKETHPIAKDGVTSLTAATFKGGTGNLTSLTSTMDDSLTVAGFDEPDLSTNAKAGLEEESNLLREREELRRRRVKHTTELVEMIKRALVQYYVRFEILQDQLDRQAK